MIKAILIAAFIAFAAFSTNTIEISGSTETERVQTFSGNHASHTQLAALEAEGY